MTTIETGVQFLQRIISKRQINTVLSSWFNDEQCFNKNVVEIIGLSGTGKTRVLMDLIAKTIIKSNAVFISNDQNFDLLHLKNLCMAYGENVDLNEILERLFIIKSYDEMDLKMSFYKVQQLIWDFKTPQTSIIAVFTRFFFSHHNLKQFLTDSKHRDISLIAIDNLLSFYWHNPKFYSYYKADIYTRNFIKKLQELSSLSNAVIVYTRPQFKHIPFKNDCVLKPKPNAINKRIILRLINGKIEAECQSFFGIHFKVIGLPSATVSV